MRLHVFIVEMSNTCTCICTHLYHTHYMQILTKITNLSKQQPNIIIKLTTQQDTGCPALRTGMVGYRVFYGRPILPTHPSVPVHFLIIT